MIDEILLLKKTKNGDQNALHTLAATKQNLVVGVAKRFLDNGLTLQQLIGAGNRGLMKAAKQFDESKGYQFSTYAIWCIRQSIIEALTEKLRYNPLPLNKIGLISKGNHPFTKLDQYCKREPSVHEIAGMLEFETKIQNDVRQSKSHHHTYESLSMSFE